MNTSMLRPLSAGEILDGAFRIYLRNFVTLIGRCALLLVPMLPLTFMQQSGGNVSLALILSFASLPINAYLTAVVMAMCVYAASEAAHGREVDGGELMKRSFVPAIVLALLSVLYGIVVLFGCFCLLVPGILFIIMFFAYAQVWLLEDEWNFFVRSKALADGAWGKILGVSIVAWLIAMIAASPIYVSSAFAAAIDAESGEPTPLGMFPAWVGLLAGIGSILGPALVTPFTAAVTTLLYYDQRIRKEGYDVEVASEGMDASF